MIIAIRRGVQAIRWMGKWTAPFGVFKFPLPDLGEKIKEGKVKKLYVREGDRVEEFQKIADVESDKQFTEISSPEEGVIKKLYYSEDQTCQVGDIFLDIQTSSAAEVPKTQGYSQKTSQNKVEIKEKPKQTVQQSSHLGQDQVLASATVKMWAREHNIDLNQVKGTGKKGRVLKEDIIYFLEDRKNQPSGKSSETKLKAKVMPESQNQPIREVKRVQMNDLERLQQGLATYSATIPSLYLQELFDVTNLTPILEANKQKISLLSLLLKSFSLALTAHQRINSIYKTNDEFRFGTAHGQNLLLALYNKAPLAYSLINNLEKESIIGIQKKLDSVGEGETEASKVREMIGKATISLSYVGEAAAMTMNPPIVGETVCHLSIGEAREVAVWEKGQTLRRKQVSVVLGGDHRVLDGASAARFMTAWRQLSESPTTTLLTMV